MVEGYLRRRQFRIVSKNPRQRLLLPAESSQVHKAEELLYRLLGRYSFRLFLRECVKARERFTLKHLTRFCSERVARKYLALIERVGIVEPLDGSAWRLCAPPISDFSHTLEWFVARLLEIEFNAPSLWGVRLSGARCGGDFDVLSEVEGKLLYVEVKSSPPKHVEQREVSAYFNKLEELKPDFSFFLEDTHLRMKDKIVPLFGQEIARRGLGVSALRLDGEIFLVGERVYIMNARPDIASNLGYCLKHYLGRGWHI